MAGLYEATRDGFGRELLARHGTKLDFHVAVAQQQTAVTNAYTRVTQDLGALASYYRQSPLWDPAWGSSTINTPGQNPAPGGGPIMGIPEQQPGFDAGNLRTLF